MNPALPGYAVWALPLCFLVTAAATGVVRRYAAHRLLDLPNERSSHTRPTPRGGGLAIVAAFALAVAFLHGVRELPGHYALALAGALPVAAVGWLDDHGHVSARLRLLVQFAAAAWSLAWLGGFDSLEFGGERYRLGDFGSIMAAFFVVWLVNLFNFMDGIDGIAGTETTAVCLGAAVLLPAGAGEAGPWLALAAAAAGFLVWNWPPARIFMGDVGSGSIGFLLAVMALRAASEGQLSLVAWHILAGVFYVDATVTLMRRMASGQRWYEAHRSHAYQHLARRWAGHRPVSLAVLGVDLLWLFPWAAAGVAWPQFEGVFLLLALAPLVALAFRLGAGRT